MTCPATLRLPTLALSLLLLLTGSQAGADQLYINGMLFRDGDSVVRLLQHAGPPLWVSQLGYRCDERYYRYWRHRHDSCRYRRLVERWTYIDDFRRFNRHESGLRQRPRLSATSERGECFWGAD
jgi:hypothetical protein